jgi:hypothetical protein
MDKVMLATSLVNLLIAVINLIALLIPKKKTKKKKKNPHFRQK